MSVFADFRAAMMAPDAPHEPMAIAALLYTHVRRACADANLPEAEIYCGGNLVTMLLTPTSAWEAVCVSPDAYQLYPGFISNDGERISWPNIWVADNYSLSKFTDELEEVFAKACARTILP